MPGHGYVSVAQDRAALVGNGRLCLPVLAEGFAESLNCGLPPREFGFVRLL